MTKYVAKKGNIDFWLEEWRMYLRQERIKVSRIQGWGPLNIEEVDHARSLELLLVTWGEDANKGEVGKNCAELAWSGAGEHSYSA